MDSRNRNASSSIATRLGLIKTEVTHPPGRINGDVSPTLAPPACGGCWGLASPFFWLSQRGTVRRHVQHHHEEARVRRDLSQCVHDTAEVGSAVNARLQRPVEVLRAEASPERRAGGPGGARRVPAVSRSAGTGPSSTGASRRDEAGGESEQDRRRVPCHRGCYKPRSIPMSRPTVGNRS